MFIDDQSRQSFGERGGEGKRRRESADILIPLSGEIIKPRRCPRVPEARDEGSSSRDDEVDDPWKETRPTFSFVFTGHRRPSSWNKSAKKHRGRNGTLAR